MNIYKGKILTLNENDDVFNYLVEDKGTIIFTGNELPKVFCDWPYIDLKDGCLIPTFVDSHQHFASFALFHSGLNVMDARSNKEICSMLKEFVKDKKEKFIICFGASPYSVEEKVLVSKKELDEVCPDKAVAVVKYDGHACVINTCLMNLLKDKIQNERGFHFESGEMNQEAFFKVSDYMTNSVSIPKLIKNMQKAIDYEAKQGIGMIHTVSGVGFPLNADITLEKIFGRALQRGFQLRVFAQSMNVKVATSRHLPRIGGCFECALDGCFGSQDASLNAPYTSDPNNSGILYYSDEKVINFCKEANRRGLQIEMHAIGDKAFDQATRALKAALDDCPREDHRHGIIHDCLPTPEGIEICSKYHIQMPVQTAFIDWKQEPDEYLLKLLGQERFDNLNPVRTFFDKGILVSAGSDGPCTDPRPLVWIDKVINATNPKQHLTIQEALRMCTINGYKTTFDEDIRGTLEVGKIADMVILNKNPYEVDPKDFHEVKVLETILQGKEYQPQKQGILKLVLKGLFSRKRI